MKESTFSYKSLQCRLWNLTLWIFIAGYIIICNLGELHQIYRLQIEILPLSVLKLFLDTHIYASCTTYDDACVLFISVSQTHNAWSRNGWLGEITTLMMNICFWYKNIGAFLEGKAYLLAFDTLHNFRSIHQTNKSLLICSGEWKKNYINEFCPLASKPFYKDDFCFRKHVLFLVFISVSVPLIVYDAS